MQIDLTQSERMAVEAALTTLIAQHEESLREGTLSSVIVRWLQASRAALDKIRRATEGT